jgi:intracellular sulfur oxidation DsrE/DsrF family protein
MNVIFHIDESAKWPMVLNNVQHYHEWLTAHRVNAQVEILANGDAVTDAVQGSKVDLSAVANGNTSVSVCANSLNQRHIDQNSLQTGLHVVPVGVIELAQKQQAGFAYIRP